MSPERQLRVEPIYGWGWFQGETLLDVPPPCQVVAAVEEGPSFLAVGQVMEPSHFLDGLWIRLSQRHRDWDGCCDLEAFRAKPTAPSERAQIHGYAMVVVEVA